LPLGAVLDAEYPHSICLEMPATDAEFRLEHRQPQVADAT
jgi:hypothetical protein